MYYVTKKEIAKLDKLAVKNGLEIRQMMELAGWQMISLFKKLKIPQAAGIVIVCGKGNKGGDGLSAARHLVNNGWKVSVVLLLKNLKDDPKHHLKLLKKMNVPVILYSKNKAQAQRVIKNSKVLIDALIGYNLKGAPRGLFGEVIKFMNNTRNKIIAYDLPSGVNTTSGQCLSPCIKAYATLSLAIPKRAFNYKQSRSVCGKIFVADIGIPKFLYNKVHLRSRPSFEKYNSGLVPLK